MDKYIDIKKNIIEYANHDIDMKAIVLEILIRTD